MFAALSFSYLYYIKYFKKLNKDGDLIKYVYKYLTKRENTENKIFKILKSYFTKKYCREFARIFPKRPIYMISSIDKDTSVDDIKNLKRIKIKTPEFLDEEFVIDDFKDSLIIFDDTDCVTDKKLRTKINGILGMILETGRHTNTYCIYTSHLATAGNDTKRILNESHSITFFPKNMGNRMMKYLCEGYLGLDKKEIEYLKKIQSRSVTVMKTYPKVILGDKDIFLLSAVPK